MMLSRASFAGNNRQLIFCINRIPTLNDASKVNRLSSRPSTGKLQTTAAKPQIKIHRIPGAARGSGIAAQAAAAAPQAVASSDVVPEVSEAPLLLGNWLCPFVHRVYLALAHKQVDMREIEINLRSKPDWLPRFSPLGKVPAVTYMEGGEQQVLIESMVLLYWVEEFFADQGPSLLPANPSSRATARLLMSRFESGISGAFYRLLRCTNVDEFCECWRGVRKEFKWLEDNMHPTGPFMMGERPGIVDAAVGPWLLRAFVMPYFRNVDVLEGHPRLQTWLSAYRALPEVQRTMRSEPGGSRDWETGMKEGYVKFAGEPVDMSAAAAKL